jgi:nitroimidazol reductase NimA-like FMN-containing flavoprotein (pyridoxamine 5'-phosphate oxidase superfamily)
MTDSPRISPLVGAPPVSLGPQECWQLLGRAMIGRLAMAVAGDVDIFPVNYLVDDGSILFRSAEGTKLVEVVISGTLAFEVDGLDPEAGEAWSVVVKGRGEILDEFDDIYRAQELPLHPWNAPDQKQRFVRIVPEHLTGRRFRIEIEG